MNIARRQMWVRYYIPSYLYAGLIFAISSYSLMLPPGLPSFSDKVIHFIEYAIFGALLARSYLNARSNNYRQHFVIMAFLTGVLWGLLDEFHQSFVPLREFEYLDLLSDAVGISAGIILYKLGRGFNKIAE